MTIDEIKEAVGKQPELKTAIVTSFKDDFVSGASAEGLVVRTKEQDQQYLDNHVNTIVNDRVSQQLQNKVNEEYGNAMRKIDDEIKAISGIEKKPGEKTTDYAKRAIEEKRQGGDPVTKQKVEQLEALLANQKSEFEGKLQKAEKDLFDKEIGFSVDSFLSGANIFVPAHLKTDEEKQAFVNQQKSLIRQGFLAGYSAKKDEQGNTIYYEDGKPVMSQKDGKPQSASDIIGSKFSSYFVPASQQGAGTGAGSSTSVVPDGGFKKTEDIHTHLRSIGVAVGTKEYMTQFEKLANDSKLDI